MIAPWVLGGLASFLAALAMFLVARSVHRIDNLEAAQARQDREIAKVRLEAAEKLATKEDVREVSQKIEALTQTLLQVRDIVIVMEAERKRQ